MTTTAAISKRPSPLADFWNSWAVPWNPVVSVAGSSSRAACSTFASPSPSDTPGARSNEIVTAGSCPAWATVSGPTPRSVATSESIGTSAPSADRTYSRDNRAGSRWYSGRASSTTRYSFVGE